jgi:ADP-ribosylglycohydrolase
MLSETNREKRALLSLRGLSIGDAFGECFFTHPDVVERLIAQRAVRPGPWRYTDDTMMALSVFETLRRCGTIDQNALARSFSRHYDNSRGYGPAMHGLLARIDAGEPWRVVAGGLFGGTGSYGNGSAMRVAPLGAFFADDLARIPLEAEYSAVVTHAHAEAVAGAIAVAVAAAIATCDPELSRREFLDAVMSQVPESEVRTGIYNACQLREDIAPQHAAAMLGNGSQVSCQDTVPFSLWCAAGHLRHFAEALWCTVSGLGDRDTTCAIVGGIVACSAPAETIPDEWIAATETLPLWVLCDLP